MKLPEMQDSGDKFLLALFLSIFFALTCVSFYFAKENKDRAASSRCNAHFQNDLFPKRNLANREDILEIIQLFKSINSTLRELNTRVGNIEKGKEFKQINGFLPRKFRRQTNLQKNRIGIPHPTQRSEVLPEPFEKIQTSSHPS